jgi:hypothetical protein
MATFNNWNFVNLVGQQQDRTGNSPTTGQTITTPGTDSVLGDGALSETFTRTFPGWLPISSAWIEG